MGVVWTLSSVRSKFLYWCIFVSSFWKKDIDLVALQKFCSLVDSCTFLCQSQNFCVSLHMDPLYLMYTRAMACSEILASCLLVQAIIDVNSPPSKMNSTSGQPKNLHSTQGKSKKETNCYSSMNLAWKDISKMTQVDQGQPNPVKRFTCSSISPIHSWCNLISWSPSVQDGRENSNVIQMMTHKSN